MNADFWRLAPRLLAGGVRSTLVGSSDDEPTRFVATHHKVMTTYFSAVLRLFALATNASFAKEGFRGGTPTGGLVLSMHSTIDLAVLGRYRGVHVMRDPRDVIVSSYFYHRWTQEPWAQRPDQAGTTYRSRLNSVSQAKGLHMEIDHFTSSYGELLNRWDVTDPDILEVRFDDLMGPDRESLYVHLFEHLGYSGRELAAGCALMRMFEAGARTGASLDQPRDRSHIRLAQSGQWREVLTPEHHRHLERQLGPILEKFEFSPVGGAGRPTA